VVPAAVGDAAGKGGMRRTPAGGCDCASVATLPPSVIRRATARTRSYEVPFRSTAIDANNTWHGQVQVFWNVDQASGRQRHGGAAVQRPMFGAGEDAAG
jgi:hypothetical protein